MLNMFRLLPYIGMTAILFNDAEPFEQNVNIPSTEGPMWNLVKTQWNSELQKKTKTKKKNKKKNSLVL